MAHTFDEDKRLLVDYYRKISRAYSSDGVPDGKLGECISSHSNQLLYSTA